MAESVIILWCMAGFISVFVCCVAGIFIRALAPERIQPIMYLVVFVASTIILFGIFTDIDKRATYSPEYVVEDTPIYSLHDRTTISGYFTLGSGYIDGYPQYVFYRSVPGGGLKQEHIRTDNVVIYQDEDENPYIRSVYKYRNYTYTGRFERDFMWFQGVELHVPNGTVIQEFRLDD